MLPPRDDDPALARRLREAVTALLDSLDEAQRSAVCGSYEEPERTAWTYLPGRRPGVRLSDLGREPVRRVGALLALTYSTRGLEDAGRVVQVEAVRRGLPETDPDNLLPDLTGQDYWVRVLGAVTDPVWSWRVSGHHLVAQATVVKDQVALTPQFFGASPSRVSDGPSAGLRVLPAEEDLARGLTGQLQPDQRRAALQPLLSSSDIGSRHDPVVRLPHPPGGLAHARMDRSQQQVLEALVRQFLDRAPAAVADRAWADIADAGVGELSYTWAGGLRPGERHRYAVAGPTLLLEYDNTQDEADHIHSVWRDLRHDWGGDLLAGHYRDRPHAG